MHKPSVVTLAVTLVLGFLSDHGSAEAQEASPGEAFKCELTKANGRYPPTEAWGAGSHFYGNESIGIGLGPEGRTVTFKPGGSGFVLWDGSLRYKFLWAKARLPMSIEGRRLDAPAAPLRAEINHEFDDDNFQPSSLVFSTPGCWEITSRVGESTLTFVIKVVKIGDGPSTDPHVRRR
jgi:hypothetical protein